MCTQRCTTECACTWGGSKGASCLAPSAPPACWVLCCVPLTMSISLLCVTNAAACSRDSTIHWWWKVSALPHSCASLLVMALFSTSSSTTACFRVTISGEPNWYMPNSDTPGSSRPGLQGQRKGGWHSSAQGTHPGERAKGRSEGRCQRLSTQESTAGTVPPSMPWQNLILLVVKKTAAATSHSPPSNTTPT